jgi:hypothetical protein
MIGEILDRVITFPDNEYVFQSKNPRRLTDMIGGRNWIRGTTIESDYWHTAMAAAPRPPARFVDYLDFITVEPIMAFSAAFAYTLLALRPHFINIGADSKGCGLPEPTTEEVRRFVDELRSGGARHGIEIKLKSNLARLLPEMREVK